MKLFEFMKNKQENNEFYYSGIKLFRFSRQLWNMHLYIESVLL